MMTREQAIFFETIDDLDLCGYLEPLFFAYHEFNKDVNFSNLTDIEVQKRAKECLLRFKEFLFSNISFYDMRWDMLEKLDLEKAEWDYLDKK